jgi:tRNA dimethylallyltransferase
MFKSGVVEEVRSVTDISPTASQAIGFREIRSLLAGEFSQAECISFIQQQTRNYAKRQLTWFRKEPHFQVVTLVESDRPADVVSRVLPELHISEQLR